MIQTHLHRSTQIYATFSGSWSNFNVFRTKSTHNNIAEISETGPTYKTPFKPQIKGNRMSSGSWNMTCRLRDAIVPCFATPMDGKKLEIKTVMPFIKVTLSSPYSLVPYPPYQFTIKILDFCRLVRCSKGCWSDQPLNQRTNHTITSVYLKTITGRW